MPVEERDPIHVTSADAALIGQDTLGEQHPPGELVPAHPTGAVVASTELEPAALLRAFEPVVRFTKGESFFPVDVGPYVAHAALWRRTSDDETELAAQPGDLDLSSLAEAGDERPGPGQSLSLINVGIKQPWRERFRVRDHRARLKGGSRLAEVGLLGRTIDSVSRLSLIFRGSVPGGSAAKSYHQQQDYLHPERPTYFGRVIRDGGYLICQYWFFYSFNNWRSGFGGVNEHEADWEQVTIYLDGTGSTDAAGLPIPRWVVFSAHDETGDDLRRRWDDPDLTVVGRRHPVVFAGAGSHSGAYLAGDYLITLEPPSLGGVVTTIRKLARIMTPWNTSDKGVGIPYIDYARGDGMSVGPDQEHDWTQVVIDEHTPWVRDYRGLWGHDTKDRLGGERGPAGPRYERDGTVRMSWADPVGWAGLSKVAPNPALEQQFTIRRVAEIDAELDDIDAQVHTGREALRTQTAGLDPALPAVRALAGTEHDLLKLRMTATRLADERARLYETSHAATTPPEPHAHLTHRLTPIEPANRARSRLLSVWAILSTPLILLAISQLILPSSGADRTTVLIGALAALLSIEALARGYFFAFLLRAAVVVGIGYLLYYGFQDWQLVLAWTMTLTALLVLLVNLRDALWR